MSRYEAAWEANLRYEEYRKECYSKTLENIATLVGGRLAEGVIKTISLGPIRSDYGFQVKLMWGVSIFDWEKLIGQFYPYINRFEVAVHIGHRLMALSYGKASKGDNVTIHFLERCETDNPLAGFIAAIVTDVADNYARVLGKRRVKIKDPSEKAIEKYKALGFSLAEQTASHTYYARKVEY